MAGHAEIFEALRREILAGKYDADRANAEALGYFDNAGIAVVLLDYDIAAGALQVLASRIKSPDLPPRRISLHAPLVVR